MRQLEAVSPGHFRRPLYEDDQMLFAFARPDTHLYTNMGMDRHIDKSLIKVNRADMLGPQAIIAAYHGRGSDELVFRALKDFGFEQLPFSRFAANAAFYCDRTPQRAGDFENLGRYLAEVELFPALEKK